MYTILNRNAYTMLTKYIVEIQVIKDAMLHFDFHNTTENIYFWATKENTIVIIYSCEINYFYIKILSIKSEWKKI